MWSVGGLLVRRLLFILGVLVVSPFVVLSVLLPLVWVRLPVWSWLLGVSVWVLFVVYWRRRRTVRAASDGASDRSVTVRGGGYL